MSDIIQDVVHVGDWVAVTYNESMLYDFPEPYKSLQKWEGEVIEIEENKFWIKQTFGDMELISGVSKNSGTHRYYVKSRFQTSNIRTNSV